MFVVLTRDPTDVVAVAAAVGSAALGIGCAVALGGVAIADRDAALARPRGRRSHRAAALRRGAETAAVVGTLGLLRVVDGLSLITGGFVVAGFVLAELVLTARRAPRSG